MLTYIIAIQALPLQQQEPDKYSTLVEDLSKVKRKREDRVVSVRKRLRLKYRDVILKKSASKEKKEKKGQKA